MANHVMIDLETMDNKPTSAIVSIGAVVFDHTGIGEKFYTNIELQSCINVGLTCSVETIYWWLQQNSEAQESLLDHRLNLVVALDLFTDYLEQFKLSAVWGNGADFDNMILANAYKAVNRELPWKFYMNRCFRTMKKQHNAIKLERKGYHNAQADAIWQAEYLIEMCKQGDIKL